MLEEKKNQLLTGTAETDIKKLKASLSVRFSETERQMKEEEQNAKRYAALSAEIQTEETRITEADKKLTTLRETVAATAAEVRSLRADADELAARCRYESAEAAEAERSRTAETIAEITAALEAAQKARQTAENTLSALSGRISQLEGLLAGYEPDALPRLREEKKRIEQQQTEISEQVLALHTRITANEAAQKGMDAKRKELQELDLRWSWMKPIEETAKGGLSGKERVSLETYIQMTFFDRILCRANVHLMRMSGGKYDLKRRETAAKLNAQSGLELDVIDHYNGSERSVKTLSGGEMFLASLSLALGLSEEIQASAGGVRLETLFVDEGFGSLDEDTLRQAMRALRELSDGDRLIGIISHVPELRREIDRQVVVTRTAGGASRAEILTDLF